MMQLVNHRHITAVFMITEFLFFFFIEVRRKKAISNRISKRSYLAKISRFQDFKISKFQLLEHDKNCGFKKKKTKTKTQRYRKISSMTSKCLLNKFLMQNTQLQVNNSGPGFKRGRAVHSQAASGYRHHQWHSLANGTAHQPSVTYSSFSPLALHLHMRHFPLPEVFPGQ